MKRIFLVVGMIFISSICFALTYDERKEAGLIEVVAENEKVIVKQKRFDVMTGIEINIIRTEITSADLVEEKTALERRLTEIDTILVDVLAVEEEIAETVFEP